jgi:hypothetical protein
MSEQQLTTLVERVGDALQPDVRALVAGGVARGRTRRRRRTLCSALAGVTAVGALGLTALLLTRGGADPGPDVAAPAPPARVVAVAPMDMDAALAALLPGARVSQHDDEPYQYQLQDGSVRWRGSTVTLEIDSRGVGTASSARERCEELRASACDAAPGGGWVAEQSSVELDTRTGEQGPEMVQVRVYLPDGHVVQAGAERGSGVSRAVLRRLVLDDVWFD